jgi:hypothetical protein
MRKLSFCLLILSTPVLAGPWVDPGDMGLRNDIQILADAGVITGPVSSWPLSWGDIEGSLDDPGRLEDYELAALRRVRAAANRATNTDYTQLHSRVAIAENPIGIRGFANTPREDGEVEIGASWTGTRFAMRAQGSWVDDPADGKEWRADGSYAGLALGNWMFAASLQDRWWGPGWQGSLILSNNARPIPSLTIERNVTTPFRTKWLSWMGPWDFTFLLGRLEGGVQPADANFMGMRLNLRPLKNLEIGLSRTAQFCGDLRIFDDEGNQVGTRDRPCDLSTFWKLLKGQDNAGENIDPEREPGNQLAGYDLRWSFDLFSEPMAFYTQWIGEDANAFLPTQMMGLFGLESWGQAGDFGTYRVFFEWADTECDFDFYRGFGGSPNICYNNQIFEEGYRYRKRAIGSSYDNDSSVFTLGSVLVDRHDGTWTARLNAGNLNRDDQGQRDPENVRNTVAKEKTRYRELVVDYTRETRFGKIRLGAGYDDRKIVRTGIGDSDVELFAEWTWSNF